MACKMEYLELNVKWILNMIELNQQNGKAWNGMCPNKMESENQTVKWFHLDQDGMVWNRMVGMVRASCATNEG